MWKDNASIVLIPNEPYNIYNFSLKADTAFHRGDNVILNFQSDFIFQDGSRDGVAVLSVVYNNDSVAQRVLHISSASSYSLSLEDVDSIGIKAINGFFMLSASNDLNSSLTTLKMMCVSRIHLYRMRSKKSLPNGIPSGPSNNTSPAGPVPINTQSQLRHDSISRE